MPRGPTVFSQLMAPLHPQQFARLAARFPPVRAARVLSAWDHFLAMAFAQVTLRESLRDLELCLDARAAVRYHLGFRQRVARSTLADANEHRDWRLFAAVAEQLLRQARRCYSNDPSGLAEVEAIYALDASFIDLSLALCPWANWTGHDAAVKLHTLLDLRGSIPSWICITPAEAYETRVLSQLPIESGSYYVMDRGYQDFSLFRRFDQAGAFFVARAKCNVRFRVQHSHPVDRAAGLRCDQTVSLAVAASHRTYPDQLRRIRMINTQEGSSLVLWTNQFDLPALTISHLYQRRWQVELFFKWIKYNLRIRHFFGLSPNAVRIQLWSALAVYALIAIAKKHWVLPHSLHQILQILSACAFEKIPLDQLFTKPGEDKADNDDYKQLSFNDF